MIKTLAVKELREVAAIAALALALNLALVSNLAGLPLFSWVPGMPGALEEVPFAGFNFLIPFSLVTGVCAIALGLRQSAWESGKGTYLFLLHRPVPRAAVFRTKMATGLAVFAVVAVVPVLAFALWAAAPGHHPSPFEWSMTSRSWRACFVLPLVYLGAFLSGLRPARWMGTRLLPLAAAALATGLLLADPIWWPAGFPATLVLDAAFAAAVFHVARERDY